MNSRMNNMPERIIFEIRRDKELPYNMSRWELRILQSNKEPSRHYIQGSNDFFYSQFDHLFDNLKRAVIEEVKEKYYKPDNVKF